MCADGRIFSTSVYCYWMDHARCFQRVVINKFKMGKKLCTVQHYYSPASSWIIAQLESFSHKVCVSLLDILVSQDNPPSRNVLRLDLISTGCRSQSSAQFLSGDQEPWAFRGGLAGEFQRLLPIEGANDLFFQPPPLTPTSKIYTIRPYFPKDE
ncbi:hypothetical protein E2320_008720, partial [Naja naja]